MTLLVLRNNEDGSSTDEYDSFDHFLKEFAEDYGEENPQWIKCDCEMCDKKGYRYNDYGCFIFYELAKKGHLQLTPKEVVTEYTLE